MVTHWMDDPNDNEADHHQSDRYPVQDDIRIGESGQGYVLRMTRSNFLQGLSEIRKRCGKHFSTTLTSSDAPYLSKWFGADVTKLKMALEDGDEVVDGSGRFLSRYAGHQICRQNFLNRMAPRICPECLAEGEICRLSWDFSFVTACPRHEKLLIDQCPGCLKQLNWQRPAVDICNCGTYLSDPNSYTQERATELDLEVSRWMIAWIDGVPNQSGAMTNELPLLKLISPLSLHGGMNILWALSLADESMALKNASVIDGAVLERCRKTLLKAGEFSKRLTINDPETFRSSKRQTLLPILAECMHESYTYKDRSLAQSLISTVLRAPAKSRRTVSGIPVQPSLFSD